MKRFVVEKESTFTQTVEVPFTFEKSSLDSERLLQAEGVRFDNENPKYHALMDMDFKATTKHIIEAESKDDAVLQLKDFVAPSSKTVLAGKMKFNGFIGKLNVVTEPQKLNHDFICEIERVARQAVASDALDIAPGRNLQSTIIKNIEIEQDRSPKLPEDQMYNVVQEGEILQRQTFEVYYANAKRELNTNKVVLGGISATPSEDSRKLVVTADLKSTLVSNFDCSALDDSITPDKLLDMKIVQLTSIKQTSHPDVLSESSLSELSLALASAKPQNTVEQRYRRNNFTASIKKLQKTNEQTMEHTI